jgi:hypothetical protein
MNRTRRRWSEHSESRRKTAARDGWRQGRISLGLALSAIATGMTMTILTADEGTKGLDQQVAPPGKVFTFNKDIAPILFDRCAMCHRPGQSAPFSLLTYGEAKKHAKQIAEVTARRYMPPWLPEPGFGQFAGERRLGAEQIQVIQQWEKEGAREGDPSDLPARPTWTGEWQLGQPDLVVEMPKPYLLPAEGKDVYRNFIIPVPLSASRFVKALEFQPGNPKIVHHTFFSLDRTRQSRRLDGKDGQPGFPGMNVPESVQMPEGQLLGWQPGRVPSPQPEGLSWALEKDADFVLQMHLRPSGRAEVIQSKVGLYFADAPPTNTCFRLVLRCLTIDIAPGSTDYVAKDKFVLPVDVWALAVLPHAHYLCKEMQGSAILPDGTKKWLIRITDWDFNFQGDYRYADPVFLPKGTTLSMRYTFDNSTNNIRNPNYPPKRVAYGPQTTDEMAELWFQMLPRHRADREILAETLSTKLKQALIDYDEYLLRTDPTSVKAHVQLAVALLGQGRSEDARRHLHAAAQLDPQNDQPHYYLGLAFRQQHKLVEARAEFENALRLNPDNFKAHGNLGLIFAEQGILNEAESHFRSALRINPDDTLARESLDELLRARPRNK